MINSKHNLEIVDFDFEKISKSFARIKKPILFIFFCDYEERSLTQFNHLTEKNKEHEINFLCFRSKSYRKICSIEKNTKIITNFKINPIEVDIENHEKVWVIIKEHISNEFSNDAQIYIDYSSMPRNWYCMLANKVISGELGRNSALIYSHGEYFDSPYPYVGYGDFHKFSGRPNIASTRETTIFGLGFDSTRTHGIWSFLDPQLSISVIARSPNNNSHCERVIRENPEILSASDIIIEVNINKFHDMLSTLVDLSRKYKTFGDIALVPDGPKPMIIAMSLVPYYLNEKGVYCWHVDHVESGKNTPIDVKPSGEFFGFGVFDL